MALPSRRTCGRGVTTTLHLLAKLNNNMPRYSTSWKASSGFEFPKAEVPSLRRREEMCQLQTLNKVYQQHHRRCEHHHKPNMSSSTINVSARGVGGTDKHYIASWRS
jgi:hypothetical protein